jgi:hypothetical protein
MSNDSGTWGDIAAPGTHRAVFISYASEDADVAQRICASPRPAGIDGHLTVERIWCINLNYAAKVVAAILNTSRHVVEYAVGRKY